jgi:DNA-binding transcriptional LysR family regulator
MPVTVSHDTAPVRGSGGPARWPPTARSLDDALAANGFARHVAAVVGSFAVAALMVAGSDLVGLVPRRLAEQYGAMLGLRALARPIDLPPVPIRAQWHGRLDADPAQRWLRAHLRAAASPG